VIVCGSIFGGLADLIFVLCMGTESGSPPISALALKLFEILRSFLCGSTLWTVFNFRLVVRLVWTIRLAGSGPLAWSGLFRDGTSLLSGGVRLELADRTPAQEASAGGERDGFWARIK